MHVIAGLFNGLRKIIQDRFQAIGQVILTFPIKGTDDAFQFPFDVPEHGQQVFLGHFAETTSDWSIERQAIIYGQYLIIDRLRGMALRDIAKQSHHFLDGRNDGFIFCWDPRIPILGPGGLW